LREDSRRARTDRVGAEEPGPRHQSGMRPTDRRGAAEVSRPKARRRGVCQMTRVTGRFEDSHVRLRFGDVEFDALTRQLWRGGQEVHLSTKAFDLLTLLMERRPTVVPKHDIKKHLWPETFVSDTNLPTLIAEIRDAIGDDGRRARFVRTVYGFGYSFVGDAVDSGGGRADAVGWLIGAT